MNVLRILSIGVLTCTMVTAAAEDTFLVRDGHSDYAIVLSDGASPSEKKAAEEVQEAIRQRTTATLPIVTEAPPDNHPMIVIGGGKVAEKLGVRPDAAELGNADQLDVGPAQNVGPKPAPVHQPVRRDGQPGPGPP